MKGIRAAMCYDLRTVVNSREHNNANVLTLGGPLHRASELAEIAEDLAGNPLRRRAAQGAGEQDHGDRARRELSFMDQKDLIEKIVGEMDQKELVERIVTEVMSKLAAAGQAVRPAGAPAAGAKGILGPAELAKYIDHTLLRPEAPLDAFDKLCAEALQYSFFSVCVNSCRVAYVARKLRGTGVKVCSVVGFPLGAMATRAKAFEAHGALEDGAAEIDMVINVGALKSRRPQGRGGGHPRRAAGQPRHHDPEGDHRDRPAHPGGEGAGLRARQEGGRRLREDLHGLRGRGGHRRRTSR